MTNTPEATDKDLDQMRQMLTGCWVTQLAAAVASFSIADHLAEGPATAEEIATAECIDATATFRLLRACASLGLATCDDGRRFFATPLLGALRSKQPGSLRSLAIALASPGMWLPWGRFVDAVRTGDRQTGPALGTELWDYYARHPKEGSTFTSAMQGSTSRIAKEVANLVDTSSVRLAIDVGGASGTLLHSLLVANPGLRGIVFDLPTVVPRATAAAAALGLADRCTAVAGDFRDFVPEADLYLLKYILHDWADAQAVRILENCRRAIRPGGRVVIIEMVLGEIGEAGLTPLLDLHMMVTLTGRERTLIEYQALLEQAGFRLGKTSSTDSPFSVMEAAAA